jgi:hypothetical protein
MVFRPFLDLLSVIAAIGGISTFKMSDLSVVPQKLVLEATVFL